MTVNPRQLLAETLRDEIEKLRRVQAEILADQANFGGRADPPSIHDLRGIASVLTDIYQGAEIAFQRIAKTTGEGVPSGPEWHRMLLDQMRREAPNMRPAVLQAETRVALEAFRKFRHRTRHIYGLDLDWEEMMPLLAAGGNTAERLVTDLEDFCDWLDQVADEET